MSGRSRSRRQCAACKLLHRKCPSWCIFAPYFPRDKPELFLSVHKVYGASNVGKMLRDVPEESRGLAARSLIYEAKARLRDPTYGCAGYLWQLQEYLQNILMQNDAVRRVLANYIGPAAYTSFPDQLSQQTLGLGGGDGGHQPQCHSNPQSALSSLMPPPSGAPRIRLGTDGGLAPSSPMSQELMLMGGPQQREILMHQQHAQMLMIQQQQPLPQQQNQRQLKEQETNLEIRHTVRTDDLMALGGAKIAVDAGQQQHQQLQEQDLLNLRLLVSVLAHDQTVVDGAAVAVEVSEQHQQQQLQGQQSLNLEVRDGVPAYEQVTFGGATIAVDAGQQQHQQQLQEQDLLYLGFPVSDPPRDQMVFGGAAVAVDADQHQQQQLQEQGLFTLGFPDSVCGITRWSLMALRRLWTPSSINNSSYKNKTYSLLSFRIAFGPLLWGHDQEMAFRGAATALTSEQQQHQQQQLALQDKALLNFVFPDIVVGYEAMAFDHATTAVAAEPQQQQQQEMELFNLGLPDNFRRV